MKTAAKFLALAFAAIGFSSCCALGPCGKEKPQTQVVEYEKVEVPGAKGVSYETQAVTKTVEGKCKPCTYNRCVERTCCGGLSEKFYSRVTAQPSTGSPFIGLVPTMKPLAE